MVTNQLPSTGDEYAPGYATHEVMNQPGALQNYNAFAEDKPLDPFAKPQ